MEKVRLGIIGCGGMGRHHGKRFIQTVPEAEIVALADPNADNLARFITEVYPEGQQPEATFADYRAMLEAVDLDGVVIISPHAHHYQQAVDAIDAGCHVLVEKPMVIRTEDAQALIAHGRKHDKVISVAFPGPFTREFSYIREVIARGDLGEIYLVTGVCAQNWVRNVGGTWRTELALSGGGNLYDSGAHMFNAMLYLTGLSATDVFAFIDNKDQEVDMIASVALRFTKGALGTATVSGDSTVMEQGIYIQGTKGSIKTSIYGGELEHWDGDTKVRYPVVPATPSLQQNFIDCIKGRDTTPSPPLLGLRQARLMDAIYESARRGTPVSVVTDEE
jgi:predicted dehydrogenase